MMNQRLFLRVVTSYIESAMFKLGKSNNLRLKRLRIPSFNKNLYTKYSI